MSTIPDKTIFDDDVAEHLDETARGWIERPVLIMLDGRDVNQRHRIDKPQIQLGRDLLNDIVMADNKCSRRHARLIYRNFDCTSEAPQVVLCDLNSTNGCFVNGVRVTGEVLLSDRDRVLVGSTLFGFFLRDESELEADQKLFYLASNDALTGLRNRGVFNMELQREFDRARRYGRCLSLVLFDIDHFKRFNDTYGHLMGDFVLQEIGRLVTSKVRGNDIGARYGGEEFAIILPETPLEGALIQAERLRQAIAAHSFSRDQTSFSLTVSVGIATVEASIGTMEEFIKWSDRALYRAKDEGRNRIAWVRGGEIVTGTRG